MKQAHRFSGKGQPYEGLTVLGKHGPRWTGTARFVPEMLDAPLKWRNPRRVFVNSMSDLFHEDITDEQIAAVFGVMAACPHTFQVLTKRPERMKEWFDWAERLESPSMYEAARRVLGSTMNERKLAKFVRKWPLPNVWAGVSCEDQQRADERIPLLLQCPAAVHWVSAEPLIGPIDFGHIGNALFNRGAALKRQMERGLNSEQADDYIGHPQLDWVVCGGESGPRSRPCDIDWIRSIVKQCKDAGTACFVKQDFGPKPGKQGRIPDDLWSKEFPDAR